MTGFMNNALAKCGSGCALLKVNFICSFIVYLTTWLYTNKYESTCRKVVVAWLKVPSQYLPWGIKGNKESSRQRLPSPDRDLNPIYPEYEARVKTTRSQRSLMYSVRLLIINNMNVFVTFHFFHSRIKLIKIVKRNWFRAFHDCINSNMWHCLPF
jgi:hypothetical protein